MKKSKILLCLLWSAILSLLLCVNIFAHYDIQYAQGYNSYKTFANGLRNQNSKDISEIKLYPGGMPFGVKIISKGLYVVGFADNKDNIDSPAYDAGVRMGDIILQLDGKDISTIEDFTKKLNENKNKTTKLTVKRGNSILEFSFIPKYFKEDNSYKAGLCLKDSTSGIGTVTYIQPETGMFGGLGHGICDPKTGELVPLSKGIIMDVTINGVNKGKVGTAGELKGTFNIKRLGSLISNTDCGVFGIMSLDSLTPPEGALNVAKKEEVKEGDAYIWCTLGSSAPCKYKVYISNIDTSCSSIKNFRVKVTDPALLKETGGIVQGMSGSPIIQNGKIIGAVTHVLVNDPTSGYGIFIENMLNKMGLN